MNPFFNDSLDDPILVAGTNVFSGWDASLKPTLLSDSRIQQAVNVRMDVDGLCRQRPAFRFVSGVPGGTITGVAYFDIHGLEKLVVASGGSFYEVFSHSQNAMLIPGPTASIHGVACFSQLVDRLFYVDGTQGIGWMQWPGGSVAHGRVQKDLHGNNMPLFTHCVAHGYRLFASMDNADEVWVSKYLDAATEGDAQGKTGSWDGVQQVFRVGEGAGDAITAMVSFQGNRLVVFKEGSIYTVSTADEHISNFSIERLTGLFGCVAGRTAVQLGQDVLFLSRLGVMSLGAMVLDTSVSQVSGISAPIRRIIDSINWSVVSTAWAVSWNQYYIIALPLNGEEVPSVLIAYNAETKEWVGEWNLAQVGELQGTFSGFTCGSRVRYSGLDGTMICDRLGRIFLFDERQDVDTYDSESSTLPIAVSIRTKSWDMQLPDGLKQLFRVIIEGYHQTTPELNLYIKRDGLDEEFIGTYALDGERNRLPFMLPFFMGKTQIQQRAFHVRSMKLGRWREVSLRFETKGRGHFSLRKVAINAFADTGLITY